ncbi:acyl-CoA dehydrogenase family protein [Mycobacterium montefiorense]|uniref:Acyl-CoA dehydrogenase n=1 Tax=Mycobacterium montefiorense TaxID=154654 RepID=A0AA37PMA4_9MYCO|nr:acyl-CoA dehydrogenase [Mycobacterium montefiorense]GBG35999.1 putative acyl-CoA dehydrogenase [Mycobacterium montefiorense]GKU33999.1 putative acyl-CoA dehydrogenase [Mycobacterium montefiorense]GKU41397.1 putative acyl-CoA dehydrogenase [Mycobacterium montefiorense]GKU47495.1 putative acyl-CoA dehydrogenase [Mycobacterium montefiorense]GKU52293.1 putative acyl-CoA dehydrogenase [Mycobacterium montefiorense]
MINATVATDATIEEALGDPFCPTNPHGVEALLTADSQGLPPDATYSLLNEIGLQRIFVPTQLGGSFSDVLTVLRTLQPVFARDAGLGLGYGVTSLMAGLNVWHSGSAIQQRELADRLLASQSVSVAYHELDHGNDFSSNSLQTAPDPCGYRLHGRKEVINNAGRASSAVVFARTSDTPGRSHSLFLVDLGNADAPEMTTARRLPRFRTMALCGAQLAGLEFEGHPVTTQDRIGAEGHGIEIALKSFQVSRVLMAGAALGPVDISLHMTAAFASQRIVYERRVAEIPHARTNLAIAQSLLLAVDAAVSAAAVCLHTAPEYASSQAAAVKYAAPILLESAMEHLAVVLGARFYLRTGPFALFGKHYRDLAPLGIGHAGSTSCLLSLLPQIRQLLRENVDTATRTAASSTLPPLDYSRLSLRTGSPDPIVTQIPHAAQLPHGHSQNDAVADTIDALARLRNGVAALPASSLGVTASPDAFDAAARYAKIFVAGAALAARERSRTEFSDAWVRIALSAIHAHGRRRPALDPTDVDVVMHRIERNTAGGRSLLLDEYAVQRSVPAL